jgi:hypothetical protein
MMVEKDWSSMSESEVWDEVFRRLPASSNQFLKDNPDKYDAWIRGFRDCAGIVKEELEKIRTDFKK